MGIWSAIIHVLGYGGASEYPLSGPAKCGGRSFWLLILRLTQFVHFSPEALVLNNVWITRRGTVFDWNMDVTKYDL